MEENKNEDENLIIEKAKSQKGLLDIAIDFLKHLKSGSIAEEFIYPDIIVQLIDFPITISDSKTIVDNCLNFNFPVKKRGLQSSLSWLWSVFALKKWKFVANLEGKSNNICFRIDVEETEYLSTLSITFPKLDANHFARSIFSEPQFQKQQLIYKKHLLREAYRSSHQGAFNLEKFIRTNIIEPIVLEEQSQAPAPKITTAPVLNDPNMVVQEIEALDKKKYYICKEIENSTNNNDINEEPQGSVDIENNKGNFGLGGKNSRKDVINFKEIYKRFMKKQNYPGFDNEIEAEPDRHNSDYNDEILDNIDNILEKAENDRNKLREILKRKKKNKKRFKYVAPKKKSDSQSTVSKKKANVNWIESDESKRSQSNSEEDGFETDVREKIELVTLKSRTPRLIRNMKAIKRRGKKIILSSSDSACEELPSAFSGNEKTSATMPIEILSSDSESSNQSVIITFVKTKSSKKGAKSKSHKYKKEKYEFSKQRHKNKEVIISDNEQEKRLWKKLKQKLEDRISHYIASENATPCKKSTPTKPTAVSEIEEKPSANVEVEPPSLLQKEDLNQNEIARVTEQTTNEALIEEKAIQGSDDAKLNKGSAMEIEEINLEGVEISGEENETAAVFQNMEIV